MISDYAPFGAIAQMRYTEAVSTMDSDILVTLAAKSSIDIRRPIYEYCASRGCQLGVIALSTGRPEDYARLLALLASGSFSRDDLWQLAERHGLSGTWQRGRASLSWEEKIRQVLVMREAQRSLRAGRIITPPVYGVGQPPKKRLPREQHLSR